MQPNVFAVVIAAAHTHTWEQATSFWWDRASRLVSEIFEWMNERTNERIAASDYDIEQKIVVLLVDEEHKMTMNEME